MAKKKNILITHPHLALEWHYEKNSDINPEDFTANSRRFVWWVCMQGHIWQDRISNRAIGKGCPYDCCKRFFDFKLKSLAVAHPGVAAEWDYEGNDFLSPEEVPAGSGLRRWWRCGKGHSTNMTIPDRIRYGYQECFFDRVKNGGECQHSYPDAPKTLNWWAKVSDTPADGGGINA